MTASTFAAGYVAGWVIWLAVLVWKRHYFGVPNLPAAIAIALLWPFIAIICGAAYVLEAPIWSHFQRWWDKEPTA